MFLAHCTVLRVNEPTAGNHLWPKEKPICVPRMPPAPVAEEIPRRPNTFSVWVDGQWLWQEHYWVWIRGNWLTIPLDSYYSPPLFVRITDHAIAWYPGHFHSLKENESKAHNVEIESTQLHEQTCLK